MLLFRGEVLYVETSSKMSWPYAEGKLCCGVCHGWLLSCVQYIGIRKLHKIYFCSEPGTMFG